MATRTFAPSQNASNADGANFAFPVVSFSTSGSLANLIDGTSVINPGGIASDIYRFQLPLLPRLIKKLDVTMNAQAAILTTNTITAGLNPRIKIEPFTVYGSTQAITFDGIGAINDAFVFGQSKQLVREELQNIDIPDLSFLYAVNWNDFAPNAIFSPDLAAATLVMYLQVVVNAVF